MPQYYPTLNPWQQLAAIGTAIGRNITGALYDQPQQRFQNAMTLQQMADRQALQQHQMAMQDAQLGLANSADQRNELLAKSTLAQQAAQLAEKENQLRLSQVAERGARTQVMAPAFEAMSGRETSVPGLGNMPLSQIGQTLGQFGASTAGPTVATEQLYRQLGPIADLQGAQAGMSPNAFGALRQRDDALSLREAYLEQAANKAADLNEWRRGTRAYQDAALALRERISNATLSRKTREDKLNAMKEIADYVLLNTDLTTEEKNALMTEANRFFDSWLTEQKGATGATNAASQTIKTPSGRTVTIQGAMGK